MCVYKRNFGRLHYWVSSWIYGIGRGNSNNVHFGGRGWRAWINIVYSGNPITVYIGENTKMALVKVNGGLCYTDFLRSEIGYVLDIISYFFRKYDIVFRDFFIFSGRKTLSGFTSWLCVFMRSVRK